MPRIGPLMIMVVLLSLFLCGCSKDSEYHMVLNGSNTLEITPDEQFVDPGVTFVDENNNAVSPDKQSELEKEMAVTGLDQLDLSMPGDYSITYQYAGQTLERTVKVLDGKDVHTLEADTQKPDDAKDEKAADNANGTTDSDNTVEKKSADGSKVTKKNDDSKAKKSAAGSKGTNNSNGSNNKGNATKTEDREATASEAAAENPASQAPTPTLSTPPRPIT